jgi:hypothetical protein
MLRSFVNSPCGTRLSKSNQRHYVSRATTDHGILIPDEHGTGKVSEIAPVNFRTVVGRQVCYPGTNTATRSLDGEVVATTVCQVGPHLNPTCSAFCINFDTKSEPEMVKYTKSEIPLGSHLIPYAKPMPFS